MFKKHVAALTAVLISFGLSACGGGGGGSSPTVPGPVPTPSTVPQSQRHVVFTVTPGAAPSSIGRRPDAARGPLANAIVQNPVELGAPANGVSVRALSSVRVQVVDDTGNAVTEANPPTLTMADTTKATLSGPLPNQPIPYVYNVNVGTSATPGQTTISATFPDASGTLPVNVRAGFSLSCGGPGYNQQFGTVDGLSFTSGSAVSVHTIAEADLYGKGAGCVDAPLVQAAGTVGSLTFASGATFSTGTAGSILNASIFTGAVTSIIPSDFQKAIVSTANTVIFKSANGTYVKVQPMMYFCGGDQTSLNSLDVVFAWQGTYTVSDANGNFAY